MKHLMMIIALAASTSAQTRITPAQFTCAGEVNGAVPVPSVVMIVPTTVAGIPSFMTACVPLDSSLQLVNGKLTATAPAAPVSEVIGEVPMGTVNGTNKVFTLRGTPIPGTVRLYWNGLRQKEIVDCSISGSTITFVTAPEAGAVLLADYRR